jgi:predicted TIM-barrel fold metal-dependent hydrolase
MSAPSSKTMVVDSHALAGKGVTWEDPEREVDYDPSQLLEQAARAGIGRLCVLSPRGADYKAANQFVARLCEQHRDKLIGFAVHNPQSEAGRVRQMLTEEVNSMGIRGVRSDGHPTRELVDTAAALRIPVIYYPKLNAGQTAARWYHTLAATYPQVDFVLPHLGRYRSSPWWGHMEAMDLARRYPNVYVDTSGIGSLKYLEMAVQELPPERILFGTFAPELDPRVGMKAIRLLKLPPEGYAKVMGGNILKLLRKNAG